MGDVDGRRQHGQASATDGQAYRDATHAGARLYILQADEYLLQAELAPVTELWELQLVAQQHATELWELQLFARQYVQLWRTRLSSQLQWRPQQRRRAQQRWQRSQ